MSSGRRGLRADRISPPAPDGGEALPSERDDLWRVGAGDHCETLVNGSTVTHRRPARSRGLWVLPLILLLGIFFAYPVLTLFRESVSGSGPMGLGLGGFQWFFESDAYRTILLRTFVVAATCTVICALIAYPYAYLMTITTPRLRRLLILLVLLPFWTSLMVRTYAWLVLLQESGPVKSLLGAIGLDGVQLIRNPTGVLIGMAQILLPFMVLPLYNNIAKIDRSHLLAAQSLGATPRRAFLRVYLPQSLPGLFAGSLLVFILALGFYITPALLGSPQNSMMSQLIVERVSRLLDFGGAGVMALVLTALTLVVVGIASRFLSVQGAFGGAGGGEGE